MEIRKSPYGTLDDGTQVALYSLVNHQGMTVRITPYGGVVTALKVPDGEGRMGDVVLGFDRLRDYVERNPFFGCLVGRYANRIAQGRFALEGVEYQLARNDGPNALHGGLRGFDKQVWQAWAREGPADEPMLELSLLSPDGEEGYPGTLSVRAAYTVTSDNGLRIDYQATTDKTTILNLTNHSYFNLSAGRQKTVLDHELMINADAFTPVDEILVPTGQIQPVAGTPLDFRQPTPIGARIDADDEQLQIAGGYDHNWVINGEAGRLRLAARVHEPESGRVMEVFTTEPGVQVYTGNMLPKELPGKGEHTYGLRGGFCLETQHFPDSPNQPAFPSTRLEPGQTFRSSTLYRFSVV